MKITRHTTIVTVNNKLEEVGGGEEQEEAGMEQAWMSIGTDVPPCTRRDRTLQCWAKQGGHCKWPDGGLQNAKVAPASFESVPETVCEWPVCL